MILFYYEQFQNTFIEESNKQINVQELYMDYFFFNKFESCVFFKI